MKKFDFRKIKIRPVQVEQLSDRALLLNVYLTQLITVIIGILVLVFQGRNPFHLLQFPESFHFLLWGAGFAAVAMAVDLIASRFAPEEAVDDGGINERLFGNRPLWHIAVLSLIVSICEELLFRGAIQHAWGAYWTSILFAALHLRYLKHWLMTGLVFSISYGLGWIYMQTGTIWTPIFAHFLIDFVMGCILKYRRD
ncbi:CPBP family intramembrane glutamic endopeptidase [Paenibacillus sp. y28]|uniref:CPBP family intramembrane glutamic endopeptidase n=1 Tax=Paenibacillus sp. y28 TaxID=3129110 RepID=UPI00301B57CD